MTSAIDAMVGRVERRCRSALAHDRLARERADRLGEGRVPYERTAVAELVRTADRDERAAISLWGHAEQIREPWREERWDGLVTRAVHHLRQVGVGWPAEAVAAVLARSRAVAERDRGRPRARDAEYGVGDGGAAAGLRRAVPRQGTGPRPA